MSLIKRIAKGKTKNGSMMIQCLCEDETRVNIFSNHQDFDLLWSLISVLTIDQARVFDPMIPVELSKKGEWWTADKVHTTGNIQSQIENPPSHLAARQNAIVWAKQILNDPGAILLDVETSSFDDQGEIVWIAVTNMQGDMLLDQLIRPDNMDLLTQHDPKRGCTPAEYHGVTPDRLRFIPAFKKAFYEWGFLQECLYNATFHLVGWNIQFDIDQVAKAFKRINSPDFGILSMAHDAMKHYGAYKGQWNPIYGEWKYWKLSEAIENEKLTMLKQHDPINDCRMTLQVIQAMADGG